MKTILEKLVVFKDPPSARACRMKIVRERKKRRERWTKERRKGE